MNTRIVLLAGCAALIALGCSDPPPPTPPPKVIGGAPAPAAPQNPAPAPSAVASVNLPPLPSARPFQEKDFSETDQSRDPFRSFAAFIVSQAKAHGTSQRHGLVEKFALDELRLVGIVTRLPSKALLTDPAGTGWVAKVGDFVGKSEVIHTGGPTGIDVALNWRVDRIRPSDVVFIREDPLHPEIPTLTRVIALRTPEEEAGLLGQRR